MNSVIYKVVDQAISDISYLGKKASTMCKNIPTYHAIPDCDVETSEPEEDGNSTLTTGNLVSRTYGTNTNCVSSVMLWFRLSCYVNQ